MEDSFRFRVDRVFGSLGNTTLTSSESVNPSLWSLTGEEIEKREWNRNKSVEDEEEEEEEEGEDLGSAVVQNPFTSDLQDLNDYEEQEIDGKKRCPPACTADAIADEHRDIQANIGLDCTLDYEEEEDQYDKVAVGMEESGDRLYMKDVKYTDYCVDEPSTYCELPNSFQVVVRDPRANHTAAKIRLKEDAEATGNFDTLPLLSETSVFPNGDAVEHRKGELEGENPKPILKKRENLTDSRSHKRVRFKVDPKSVTQTFMEQQGSGGSNSISEVRSNNDFVMPEYTSDHSKVSPGIPDYLRNPSKYTRYTFDTSETMGDQSNQKACMEFLHQFRQGNSGSSSSSSLNDSPIEVPLSVTFIPRRKQDDDSTVNKSEFKQDSWVHDKNKSFSVSLAAEDDQESEVSAMEEDEPCPKPGNHMEKPGRQYRTRTTI